MMADTAHGGPSLSRPGATVTPEHTCLVTYLIEVDHDIAFRASAALDVLQGQGEVDTPRVWDVEIVCVILVPFLDRRKNLILIGADDVHVLKKDRKGERKKCFMHTTTWCAPKERGTSWETLEQARRQL